MFLWNNFLIMKTISSFSKKSFFTVGSQKVRSAASKRFVFFGAYGSRICSTRKRTALAAILSSGCTIEEIYGAYTSVSVEPEKPATDKLYRVQVGAFAVRENAERMLQRLKDAGFEGFIREGN